jgi:hypothetical protein
VLHVQRGAGKSKVDHRTLKWWTLVRSMFSPHVNIKLHLYLIYHVTLPLIITLPPYHENINIYIVTLHMRFDCNGTNRRMDSSIIYTLSNMNDLNWPSFFGISLRGHCEVTLSTLYAPDTKSVDVSTLQWDVVCKNIHQEISQQRICETKSKEDNRCS